MVSRNFLRACNRLNIDSFWLHILPEAHGTTCVVGGRADGECTELFPKYWTESHFLMGYGIYVYWHEDLSQEDLYQKKWLMGFINDLSYHGGGIPQDEVERSRFGIPHIFKQL